MTIKDQLVLKKKEEIGNAHSLTWQYFLFCKAEVINSWDNKCKAQISCRKEIDRKNMLSNIFIEIYVRRWFLTQSFLTREDKINLL